MKKKVGNVIKALRARHNLTQQELAEAIGTDKSNMSRYEAGTQGMEFDRMVKLAGVLQVRLSELIAAAEEGRPAHLDLTVEEATLLDDFELLLDEDQERIAAEVNKLARIARAYKRKFGNKVADDATVAKHLPAAPKIEQEEEEAPNNSD